ncbi:MAG TPA: GerMN domain-containing protein [Pyrinomonadaceae bacterium]|jgi:spore germination protein GerM
MKRIYSITLLALLLIGAQQTGDASSTFHKSGLTAGRPASSAKVKTVKVYLVVVGDEGKMGRKIGCGDSLVAVTREIKPTVAPLKAALSELLALPREYAGDSRLNNFWVGRNLRVKSVSIRNGTATIYIVGEGPFVAGVCDEPRITSQIEATAKQFPTVRRVKVFVNGRTLANAIR